MIAREHWYSGAVVVGRTTLWSPSDSEPEGRSGQSQKLLGFKRPWGSRCCVPEPPERQCSIPLTQTELFPASFPFHLYPQPFLGECPYTLLHWAGVCSVPEPALESVNSFQQSLVLLSITLQSPAEITHPMFWSSLLVWRRKQCWVQEIS